MDVLIINSPLFREHELTYDEDSLPPIGLGYIASSLENVGLSVQLIDAVNQNLSVYDLVEICKLLRPSFIAFNIFTTNYLLVKEFVESIDFETEFIIGGHAVKSLFTKIALWETKKKIFIVYQNVNLFYKLFCLISV